MTGRWFHNCAYGTVGSDSKPPRPWERPGGVATNLQRVDDMSQATERPYRRRHARARPYLADRSGRDRNSSLPPPAVSRVPSALLERVRSGLLALSAAPSAGDAAAPDVRAELAALARRSVVACPEAWAPAAVNEPSPDVVTTAPLPVVTSPVVSLGEARTS